MVSLVITQPWFAVSQSFFVLGSLGTAGMGFVARPLSSVEATSLAMIPMVAFLGAVRIHRRLRAVRSEPSFDASDELLVGTLIGMEPSR